MIISHGYFYDRAKMETVWLGDTWAMDLSSPYKWTRLREGIERDDALMAVGHYNKYPGVPPGRFGHSCNVIGNSMYMFGGTDGGFFVKWMAGYKPGYERNELWRLDLLSASWTMEFPPAGTSPRDAGKGLQAPKPRTLHSATALGGSLYVYGGSSPGQGDLWEYRTAPDSADALGAWRMLAEEVPAQDGGPGCRSGASLASIPASEGLQQGGLLLHGGRLLQDTSFAEPGGTQMQMADVWLFDLQHASWKLLEPAEHTPKPPPIVYSAALSETVALEPASDSGAAWEAGFVRTGGSTTTPRVTCTTTAWLLRIRGCKHSNGTPLVAWEQLPRSPIGCYHGSLVAHAQSVLSFGGHVSSETRGSMPFLYHNAVHMLHLPSKPADYAPVCSSQEVKSEL